MINPPAVKKGDRVRVIGEGEVTDVALGGQWFDVRGHGIWPADDAIVSIEVLAQPVKVGDTIEGVGAYEALPRRAVVAGRGGVYIRTRDGFVDEDGDKCGPRELSTPRTVVYLPEVAA